MVDILGYSVPGTIASFFFILLTLRRSDDFRVMGSSHVLLALVGEDALLTCQRLPNGTAAHTEVRWYRSEPSTPIIAYGYGAEMIEVQMEEYRGRVEWIDDGIAEGRVALKIHNIRPSDNGQYWCHLQEGSHAGEASLLLKVAGLGSAPQIHMNGSVEGGIQLVCTAKGWFPEPRVRWEDSQGEQLLSLSEHYIQDANGLFYVEATVLVLGASPESASCIIHNPVVSEERVATITLPASLKVIGPSQPILVRVGEDVGITCYLSPKANAQRMEVRWVRSRRYPAVHVYMDGSDMAGEQMEEYTERTSLMSDAIQEGRLTLKIHNTSISDDGQYRCLFEKDGVYQEASVNLKVVGMGSSPLVTMKEGGKQLKCTSDGWFPEPQVQWMDRDGNMMPAFSEALTQGSHGLFHVETVLLVENNIIVNVSCCISNPLLGKEKRTTFSSPDSRLSLSWPILMIIVVLLLAVAVGLRRRKDHEDVNLIQEPNRTNLQWIDSEKTKDAAHGCSYSQYSTEGHLHAPYTGPQGGGGLKEETKCPECGKSTSRSILGHSGVKR
ncbi:butyrophilin-like protein 2 isoform X2 [Ochotona princeps]|uniref:butyrophilin-like protein 2 isoform X2 n=1 Tax=Ochotona princeps TaxID=9978 RepID=UPI0027151C0B|nr:butyrophilin-like protein 2 isoform X2 [Ochotona princeps]